MTTTFGSPGREALLRGRILWRRGARSLANILPKGLYARSLLIVIVPMVLLQTAVAYVFMQQHSELVAHRLSAAVAHDVGAMIDLYRELPRGADDKRLRTIARERLRMDVELMPPQALPPRMPHTFFDVLDPLTRALPRELGGQIREPFWLDAVGRSGLMEIRVDLGFGVLRFVTRRSLAYDANVHIFILWMLGASIVLLVVAILFLRNQIRPILRLAAAAEDFGKGRDLEFQPRGAREVRQAGYAFIEMKRRIERAAEQRMTMLNGVSHDLRTILTRFRLSLAMIEDFDGNRAAATGRRRNAGDAGRLSGVRARRWRRADDADESALDARGTARRGRASWRPPGIEAKGDLNVKVRPLAMKRCVGNLVANAQRYGDNVIVAAGREQRFVTINVDDDGPGIAPEHRENVFRPFLRLDEARNQDEGGSGLGLAIARDIARAHGGDIVLSTSPIGGLRASIRIPV